jgi:hypothetical protein
MHRFSARLAGATAMLAATALADGRLYPSGPPNGVAYLRFANLASQPVTVRSPAATIALPADTPQHRIREFDPVTPGTALTGSVELGTGTKPLDLKLMQNEFATVAVTGSDAAGPTLTVFREVPNDFNAQKSSLALFNLDPGCAGAQLLAGDNHLTVVAGVAPGAVGRRAVNPVNVALSVSCGDPAQALLVALEPLASGERYSIFVVAAASGRRVVATRDEQAPFRP